MYQENRSVMKPGDRVRHQASRDSFGTGTVLKVDERTRAVLVEWDTHEVTRARGGLTTRQTHVEATNLTVISS